MIIHNTVTLLQLVIILLGFSISYRALQIFKESDQNQSSFLFFATGFLLFSLGMTFETVLLYFHVEALIAHIIETVMAIFGAISIIVAILKITTQ